MKPPIVIHSPDCLPKVADDAGLAIRRDLARFEKGLAAILQACGLNEAAIALMSGDGGSMPVFAVGANLVVKLFPAYTRSHYEAEIGALRRLADKLPDLVPRLLHHGSLDGWTFVIMTRVGGVQLSAIWPGLDGPRRELVCRHLGAVVAEMHRIDVPTANDAPSWRAFIEQQATGCVAWQQRHGLRAELLAQIPAYIGPVLEPIKAAPCVFLHTELMLEHVFVDPDRLTIAGLIDFEPSMKGAAEYDFVAVAIFIAQGQPSLLRAFLQGYDYAWNRRGEMFAQVIMTHTLLHRYSRLGWYLDRLEGEQGRNLVDLAAVARKWFAVC